MLLGFLTILHFLPILSMHELDQAILQGMRVWVVSHGGVGSNTFASFIELHGLLVRTQQWHTSLCHAPEPLHTHIPGKLFAAVYLYGDPILAICSMKRQGNAYLNLQKLTNRLNMQIPYMDGLLLEAIYNQFKRWTSAQAEQGSFGYKIYHLSHEDIFRTECLGVFLSDKKHRLYQRSRNSSNREKCLASLNVTTESLKMAEEMLAYRGDCPRLLEQLQNNSIKVDQILWTYPQQMVNPNGARGREKQEKLKQTFKKFLQKRQQKSAVHKSQPIIHT